MRINRRSVGRTTAKKVGRQKGLLEKPACDGQRRQNQHKLDDASILPILYNQWT